jgi:hypothetical protein
MLRRGWSQGFNRILMVKDTILVIRETMMDVAGPDRKSVDWPSARINVLRSPPHRPGVVQADEGVGWSDVRAPQTPPPPQKDGLSADLVTRAE